MERLILISACWATFMFPVFGQGNVAQGGQPPSADNANRTVQNYEIVSIKPQKFGNKGGGMRILPDGFEWRNVNLYSLVKDAYRIGMDSQVSGLPEWAKSETYDIVAKADAQTAERWKNLTSKDRAAEEQPMKRSILEDRCKFKAHQEAKELPIYELVIAKGGLKMKESSTDESVMEEMSRGRIVARAMGVNTIVHALTGTVGRLIVDKTGLGDKKFDFELKWAPEDRQGADADLEPALFTALKDELGMKLVPAKESVQILVIDHMEPPSPN